MHIMPILSQILPHVVTKKGPRTSFRSKGKSGLRRERLVRDGLKCKPCLREANGVPPQGLPECYPLDPLRLGT